MIQGKVSFFDMNAHIYDVGMLVQKVLGGIFEGYGISIEQFNIESIDVPKEDYDEISKAKSTSTSRKIQGFSWQEEQMYAILDDAAKNEGTSSQMMGAGMGLGMGVGMGAPLGRAFGDMTNNAFGGVQGGNGGGNIPKAAAPSTTNGNENINVNNFFNHPQQAEASQPEGSKFCPTCGNKVPSDAMFCSKCGTKLSTVSKCPTCGAEVEPGSMFCCKCGTKLK